jgi:DNA-binding transcriptional ArsR family regulator
VPYQEPQLDAVFQALADPTRRAVLARLGTGPTSTSQLAEPFEMALPSFMQHLGMLERCGLVRSSKEGRIRTWELTPEPLEDAADWLATQRSQWTRRLDQLDRFLASLSEADEETR